jgi:hypothetical protein
MKRILIIPVLALAACGFSPEELETRSASITEGVVAGCGQLDDALTAAVIDTIAEITGTASGVDAIRAKRKGLCDAAAQPVDADRELSPPVPVAKPVEG